MNQQDSKNVSFCENCGTYLQPEEGLLTWLEVGKSVVCCRACRDMIYKERVKKEKNLMKGVELCQ